MNTVMSIARLWAAVYTLICVSFSIQAAAQTPPELPDPAATLPSTLGLMRGFPPPPDKTVRFNNGSLFKFPGTRWSFSHWRELLPSTVVWRGIGPVSALPPAARDLDGLLFTTMTGEKMTWKDAVSKTFADGILVLHKGRVIYENYIGEGAPERPHIAMSITKSFVGTLAAMLAVQGKLDPSAPVTKYVPELKDSAYADASVRQVMDMTIGVRYSENYLDPKAEIWAYIVAGGGLPAGPDYQGPRTLYDFLLALKKEGEHGQQFGYKTVNAEVLAWVVKRASGQSLADLLSSAIWQKLGAENDAYFGVDPVGSESGGGGLNTTLRDLARFGEMMRNKGAYNGQQVIPAAVVAEIERGGDKALFAAAGYKTLPGWSYKDMWWISNNAHGAYMARGIYGQSVYIDPKAEMVIVRYASHPIAPNAANDPITLPAYMAVADELMK
jgi:CubicO group peptidase (beta-lactamase class C family)